MHAMILSIGDELALGQTIDTNSAWLSARLARLGVATLMHQTIADDQTAIAQALAFAAQRAPLVIVSGGLGPTPDDLTRQALAEAMDAPLVADEQSIDALRAFFEDRGRAMPPRNRVQAMHPRGSSMIPNACGTAPGIHARLHAAQLYLIPGVPREMRMMYENDIEPRIKQKLTRRGQRRVILITKVNTFGQGESDVAERLGDLMQRGGDATVGTTVSDGICAVRVRAEHDEPAQAHAALERTLGAVEAALGPIVFGREDASLAEALVALLTRRKLTLVTAESCTGGLLGAMISAAPGCSSAYHGGWVTYTNAMKIHELNVDHQLIEAHGAVSEPVALAMAQGARRRGGADLALSITGVAGPGGGTADKPVGTVWIALADARQSVARRAKLVGDRAAIRDRAAKAALQMLRLSVLDESLDAIRWFTPSSG